MLDIQLLNALQQAYVLALQTNSDVLPQIKEALQQLETKINTPLNRPTV